MQYKENYFVCIETEENEIFVDDNIAPKAVRCIDRMLEVSK